MDTDVYKTPESEIVADNNESLEFYVVSPKKFLVLQLITVGLYSIYWFYKHWALYKTKHNEDIWPVMRGIFQIFFAHSLFEAFKIRAKEMKNNLSWSASWMATLFVILSIISAVADRMSYKEIGSPYSDLISLILLPIVTWILFKAQKVANIACNDPNGESNANFTGLNALWIVVGGCFWLVALFGYYVIYAGIE